MLFWLIFGTQKGHLEEQVLPDVMLSGEWLGWDPPTDGELRHVVDGGVHQLHQPALRWLLVRPELESTKGAFMQ